MTSRPRKDQQGHFELQADTITRNGHASRSQGKEDDGQAGSPGVGRIEVSPRAIAHVASRAAQRSYGVVGLAPRHARPGWAELLRREEAHRGVDVNFAEDKVTIDLYVVIEYGTRISEVARNIMSNVKFAVESALDVHNTHINVNVQDIRVSEEGRKA